MKQLNDNTRRTISAIAIIVAAGLLLGVIILTTVTAPRGETANHYDLECLTEPRQNPLQECKEGK